MLQPVRRRTWAPKGRTPIERSWARHDRISAISALTVAPRRRRLNLYFAQHEDNITNVEITAFVRQLRPSKQRPILLIWDRLNAHRTAARHLQGRYGCAVAIEWLPGYAPDLNPVEAVWNHTKYGDLANFIPDDIDDLGRRLDWSLRCRRSRPSALRACFNYSGLEL